MCGSHIVLQNGDFGGNTIKNCGGWVVGEVFCQAELMRSKPRKGLRQDAQQ